MAYQPQEFNTLDGLFNFCDLGDLTTDNPINGSVSITGQLQVDLSVIVSQNVSVAGNLSASGQILVASGTVGAPGLAFGSATGFYNPSSGTIGFVSEGSAVALLGPLGFAGLGAVPIGTVLDFAGPTAPPGWHLCFGQSLSTSSFAALFSVIGHTYGGSGATFNLPDCRCVTTIGVANMGGTDRGLTTGVITTGLGNEGGASTQTLSAAQIPQMSGTFTSGIESATHTHSINSSGADPIVFVGGGGNLNNAAGANLQTVSPTTTTESANHQHATTVTLGSATPSSVETFQPSIQFNKIIFAGA